MARSPGSFDAFVAANVDALARTAYLITWDADEADDLVQECLFKVARRWSRVGRMEQPVAYARRVLVSLATDGAERRARRRAELSDLSTTAVEAACGAAGESVELALLGTRAVLIAALGELAPRQRAVLVLRYFLDLSESDTAQALGCSVGTVKSTTAKALSRLRASLEPQESLPEVSK